MNRNSEDCILILENTYLIYSIFAEEAVQIGKYVQHHFKDLFLKMTSISYTSYARNI